MGSDLAGCREVTELATYHVCRICLRPRSQQFHHEHPIPTDGVPPPPGICRRCRFTSECSSTTTQSSLESTARDAGHFEIRLPEARSGGEDILEVAVREVPASRENLSIKKAANSDASTQETFHSEGGCSSVNSKTPKPGHIANERDSQAFSKTERLYLEGRGANRSSNHPRTGGREVLDEARVREIARDEIERYRLAERLLNSHPSPYAHGRMLPVRHGNSHSVEASGVFQRSGKRLRHRRSRENLVKSRRDHSSGHGRAYMPSDAEKVVIIRRKKSAACKQDRICATASGSIQTKFEEDPASVYEEGEVVDHLSSDACMRMRIRTPTLEPPSKAHNNGGDRPQFVDGSVSRHSRQEVSAHSRTGRSALSEHLEGDSRGHKTSPPYPTSDRQHLSPPSPSRSGFRTATDDDQGNEVQSDKTAWPGSPHHSRPTSTRPNPLNDHEYLYVEQTTRAISPPHSYGSHVQFEPSPERPSSCRKAEDSLSRSNNDGRLSPDILIDEIRGRSPAYHDRLSRRTYRRSSRASHTRYDSQGQYAERSQSSMRISRKVPYSEVETRLPSWQENDEAADRAGHGPYRELERVTDSTSAQDGSFRDREEGHRSSVTMTRRGLSTIREGH